MSLSFDWLRKRIFGISPEEATFARRGFRACEAEVQSRLERVGYTFLQGYHAALLDPDPEPLAQRLSEVDLEFQGFAFEGASMSLALMDVLAPWRRNRLKAFLKGPGAGHIYMVHVGLGWALARLHRRVERPLARMDALLGWLAVDGYGFHEGYFYPRRSIADQVVPKRLSGYACRVFDQGLGRSLWFVEGADVTQIAKTIAAFPPLRHADLWSGIGLACTYAGGRDPRALEALWMAAGPYQSHLAQGAAFAAKARQRAGNPTRYTEFACEILCKLSADEAAYITDVTLENLPFDDVEPAYQVWRRRIQAQFAGGDVENSVESQMNSILRKTYSAKTRKKL